MTRISQEFSESLICTIKTHTCVQTGCTVILSMPGRFLRFKQQLMMQHRWTMMQTRRWFEHNCLHVSIEWWFGPNGTGPKKTKNYTGISFSQFHMQMQVIEVSCGLKQQNFFSAVLSRIAQGVVFIRMWVCCAAYAQQSCLSVSPLPKQSNR